MPCLLSTLLPLKEHSTLQFVLYFYPLNTLGSHSIFPLWFNISFILPIFFFFFLPSSLFQVTNYWLYIFLSFHSFYFKLKPLFVSPVFHLHCASSLYLSFIPCSFSLPVAFALSAVSLYLLFLSLFIPYYFHCYCYYFLIPSSISPIFL